MTFNSLAFVFFLPIVYLITSLLPQKQRWKWLLVSSYFFYCYLAPWYGILLFLTTTLDWFVGLKIQNSFSVKTKKNWLLFSIISNLSVLGSFKYSIFFANCGIYTFNKWGQSYSFLEEIVVPAGLSFYTFQSMSYVIDVYRNKTKAESNLGTFAFFVSYFPQLVAGPVERYSHLMPQLKNISLPKLDHSFAAFRLATWGFFKKIVIADNLAKIVDPVYDDVLGFSGSTHLVVGFLFVVQVYCDFSGYSDIATGISKLFGIDLMLNWNRPLLSKSLTEFWKRNHISITSWFREYLYIGLGGNKVSHRRWLLNIFLVFVISGFWHGANLTFVIWGAMHGVLFILEIIVKRKFPNLKPPAIVGWLYLILFHTISLIAFRANSLIDLKHIYTSIFTKFNILQPFKEIHRIIDMFPMFICISLVFFLFVKELYDEYKSTTNDPSLLRLLFYWIIFFSIFLLGDFNSNEFIYFKF